jgi:hypothetical protein
VTEPLVQRRYRLFGERFRFLIAASALLGLGLYVSASYLNGVLNSVATGFASTLVALAVVTFASEYILKTAFTEDVLSITELKREIYNVGIVQVVEESQFSWLELVSASREITSVSLRPASWTSRVWPHVLTIARQRECKVMVAFIRPDSSASREAACRLGIDPNTYSVQIKQAAKEIEEEWKRAKAGPSWRAQGSQLTIQFIGLPLAHSLTRVDGKSCLVIEPMVGGAGSTVCLVFRDMNGQPFPDQWIADGVRDLQSGFEVPYYTDAREVDSESDEVD